MTSDIRHRLAALLAADAAGYSRLMANDQEATVAALDDARAVFHEHVKSHGGRVVDTAGDSVLAAFETAAGAVQAARAVQQRLAEINQPVAEDRRMRFRIGVHLGDIIEKADGSIYGDGVNIAARLEALAEPGGITVSEDIHRQVMRKIDAEFSFAGEHEVKNIPDPVRVWRLATGAKAALPSPADTKVLERPAIAVLPFANLSGDPEQEYFADGLTEDIITALSSWRSFPVIARNSTFAYKGQSPDIREVGEALGARYVLEGSLRKSGNRVRVTAQLIDAATGHHLWAEKLDRQLDDIFALQDELTLRIVATVAPELDRAEQKRAHVKDAKSLDAWDYTHRGMAALEEFSGEGNQAAREMFAKALAIDPDYARAWAGTAFAHNRDLLLHLSDDRDVAARAASAAAAKAVALDASDSLAHVMLAIAHMWPGDHDLAIAEARKAVHLNPSNAMAYGVLGTALDAVGEFEAGIVELECAIRISPRDPRNHIFLATIARSWLTLRRYEDALGWARRAIEDRPAYPHSHYMLAAVLGHLDRLDEARAALEDCERLQPGFVAGRADWSPYRDPALNEHLHAGVRKSGHGEG